MKILCKIPDFFSGVGVYVSRVEEDGPAWEAGLRPGDLLLAADNTCFSQLTHVQAITVSNHFSEIYFMELS